MEILPRKGERPSRFAERQCCSRACANAIKIKTQFAAKPCEHCADNLTPHEGEKPHGFARRRHCSRECARAAETERINVRGVMMTVADVVMMTGLSRHAIRHRMHRDIPLLTPNQRGGLLP